MEEDIVDFVFRPLFRPSVLLSVRQSVLIEGVHIAYGMLIQITDIDLSQSSRSHIIKSVLGLIPRKLPLIF